MNTPPHVSCFDSAHQKTDRLYAKSSMKHYSLKILFLTPKNGRERIMTLPLMCVTPPTKKLIVCKHF